MKEQKTIKTIYILLIINFLFALPRYAIESSSSCMNCHVNPSGGGMRNDYGSSVYALDELPLERLIKNADDNWDGYITDHLQVGGDFRIQHFDDGEESKTFPMQFDIYANLKVSKDTDIYMRVDMNRDDPNHEFFILFKNVFKKSWIKIGKSLPTYGLKLDDHTSFIRGGNLTSLTPDDYINSNSELIDVDQNVDKGLFFNPREMSLPTSIETGLVLTDHMHLNLGISSGFIDYSREMVNYSASLSCNKGFNNFSILSGLSFMKELDINSAGIFGGISMKKITLSFEIDKTKNWIDFNESMARYAQIVFKPMQGLHIIAKYDDFDKDIDFKTGFISRYSLGFEIYPLSIMEIKFQARKHSGKYEVKNNSTHEYTYPDLEENTEYLVQIHTWF